MFGRAEQMFGVKGPFCQSCGMPLSRDEQGGGTEADGSHSTEYCSRCYQGGQFIDPALTLPEMMAIVKGKMREMHFPGFLANYFTRDMPKLKRWRTPVAV